MATTTGVSSRTMTAAQMFALAAGAVYLLVGIAGWFVTRGFFGADADWHILGFHLNGAHNIVHLLLGAVWLLASPRYEWSRAINVVFGATLLLVALLGLTGVFDSLLNITSAAEPDNYLHLGTGALALWFGTAGAAARTTTGRSA